MDKSQFKTQRVRKNKTNTKKQFLLTKDLTYHLLRNLVIAKPQKVKMDKQFAHMMNQAQQNIRIILLMKLNYHSVNIVVVPEKELRRIKILGCSKAKNHQFNNLDRYYHPNLDLKEENLVIN